jgi:hypothetical protein
MIEQNLFTGKVVVEAALRGVGGYYNIADRGATISICGKQFHGFLDNFFLQYHSKSTLLMGERQTGRFLSLNILS